MIVCLLVCLFVVAVIDVVVAVVVVVVVLIVVVAAFVVVYAVIADATTILEHCSIRETTAQFIIRYSYYPSAAVVWDVLLFTATYYCYN